VDPDRQAGIGALGTPSGKEAIDHEIDAASSEKTTVFVGGVPVDLPLFL
jgi:hypothetical protein